MGYYTTYSLETFSVDEFGNRGDATYMEEDEDFIDTLAAIIDYNPFEDCCKWYEWETDMRAFSKLYPHILFCLYGKGEESGDIWKCWFLNGKSQKCVAKIVIPDYNPKELN